MDNVYYKLGGGDVRIVDEISRWEIIVKVKFLDNVIYRAGGGNV